MIFVSATLVLVLLMALILPSVVCGRKREASVVSSAKKTEKEEVETEEATEESEDSETTT